MVLYIYTIIGGYMSYKPKDNHERIVHRLRIVKGQLNKVLKMADEESNYVEIIHQSQAIQGALRETDKIILLNQLEKYKNNKKKIYRIDKTVMDLLNLFKLLNKN
jgi:DNA-binding FrmR family transcriptional regulator